jgi:hypothetical protein
MKAFAALLLVIVIFSVSIAISPAHGYRDLLVGVKEGDWIEYNINITGNPPSIHNVTWMRLEVLQVQGAAFQVNMTNKFANGTLYSSIWRFNFTEGQTEGWLIIPPNLGVGYTFYDASKPANITIQGQNQKTVVEATRTITYANDSFKTKQWDKITGVFTQSSENLGDWSAYVYAAATNIWSPQILGLDQKIFCLIVIVVVLGTAIVTFAVAIVQRRRMKTGVKFA